MNTFKNQKTLLRSHFKTSQVGIAAEHTLAGVHPKSARKVQGQIAGLSKVDARYWLKRGRLFRHARSANFSFQTQFKGKRVGFSTRTGNREAAAKVAARICADIVELGIDGAVEKHRPTANDQIATIGQYLQVVLPHMRVREGTKASYSIQLRRIAADILRQRLPRKAKVKAKRLNRERIEAASLAIFTPASVERWQAEFVTTSKQRGRTERVARISANSIIRQARCLFGAKVVKKINSLRLPDSLPFAGVELFPRESMRYVSKIDAGEILRKAQRDHLATAPHQFLVMFLGVAAGLRRGEIDRLLWSHVDFRRKRIYVEDTAQGSLKSEDSRGAVDIDDKTVELLRGFHAKATTNFVIDAPQAEEAEFSRLWGLRYRCSAVFEKVTAWLRANGVESNKPLHTLRKEAGSIIATQYGIFAAAQFLRHSDIKVTAEHYADKKTPTAIDVASLLAGTQDEPENVTRLDLAQAEAMPLKGSSECL
jgi:integrase